MPPLRRVRVAAVSVTERAAPVSWTTPVPSATRWGMAVYSPASCRLSVPSRVTMVGPPVVDVGSCKVPTPILVSVPSPASRGSVSLIPSSIE